MHEVVQRGFAQNSGGAQIATHVEEKAKLQVELLDTAKQLKESRAFSRAGFACCCVVLFCFCFLFSFFLFLAGGETVRPTARGTVSPKGVGTLW